MDQSATYFQDMYRFALTICNKEVLYAQMTEHVLCMHKVFNPWEGWFKSALAGDCLISCENIGPSRSQIGSDFPRFRRGTFLCSVWIEPWTFCCIACAQLFMWPGK